MVSKKEYLKNVEGVVYCGTPTFVIDWDIMKIYPQSYTDPSDPNDSNKLHGISRAMKFDTVEKVVDFVKKNKHQIIVYELFENQAMVILRFDRKPHCNLIP